MITLHYQHDQDDYEKAFQAYFRTMWKTWIPLFFLLIPFMGIWLFSPPDGWVATLQLLLIPAVIIIMVTFMVFILPRQSAKRLMENELTSSAEVIDMDDEKIQYRNQFSQSSITWDRFNRFIETEDYFFLTYQTNINCVRIIPKRIFGSTEDIRYFRQLVADKVENNPSAQELRNKAKQSQRKQIVLLVLFLLVIAIAAMMYALATMRVH
jgi:hypothetical protein